MTRAEMYKTAFLEIRNVVNGWVAETLYEKESTSDEIKVALAYVVSMVDTYDDVIRNWGDK